MNHTEPAILRALVRGGAERLMPVAAALGAGASLPGWRLLVLDGTHLPASEKRLASLRGVGIEPCLRFNRGAALRIRPVTAADQVDCLRLRGGLRVHVLASAATALESSSTSTASGSKSSPTHSFISA